MVRFYPYRSYLASVSIKIYDVFWLLSSEKYGCAPFLGKKPEAIKTIFQEAAQRAGLEFAEPIRPKFRRYWPGEESLRHLSDVNSWNLNFKLFRNELAGQSLYWFPADNNLKPNFKIDPQPLIPLKLLEFLPFDDKTKTEIEQHALLVIQRNAGDILIGHRNMGVFNHTDGDMGRFPLFDLIKLIGAGESGESSLAHEQYVTSIQKMIDKHGFQFFCQDTSAEVFDPHHYYNPDLHCEIGIGVWPGSNTLEDDSIIIQKPFWKAPLGWQPYFQHFLFLGAAAGWWALISQLLAS